MPMRHLATYECADDFGKRHDVQLWQDFNTGRSPAGEIAELAGTQELRLVDGRPAGYIDERTFQVLDDGMILRRVD
ncbi:hypothetical protein [Limimaricola cinnabarinus]|uniref:Uncharacterized protein n=1 Tax=Limimaricola cinnabarinus LL-001 TaxID=1337093 RepID=U3AHN1_9RHOB|nr:hypothetical protein [Limimaricola cinnabarinus]GAD57204.1 hypothetical protein MBELCI_3256 [Limimaricola cinnabarinus LL-001]